MGPCTLPQVWFRGDELAPFPDLSALNVWPAPSAIHRQLAVNPNPLNPPQVTAGVYGAYKGGFFVGEQELRLQKPVVLGTEATVVVLATRQGPVGHGQPSASVRGDGVTQYPLSWSSTGFLRYQDDLTFAQYNTVTHIGVYEIFWCRRSAGDLFLGRRGLAEGHFAVAPDGIVKVSGIGRSVDDLGTPNIVTIGEVLAWERMLSLGEIADLVEYLRAKYSLPF
jgi:hypothetical protein